MATGTVKWFNSQKATASSSPMTAARMCLFISRLCSAGMGGLAEGQKIKYDVPTDRAKATAVNLADVK